MDFNEKVNRDEENSPQYQSQRVVQIPHQSMYEGLEHQRLPRHYYTNDPDLRFQEGMVRIAKETRRNQKHQRSRQKMASYDDDLIYMAQKGLRYPS